MTILQGIATVINGDEDSGTEDIGRIENEGFVGDNIEGWIQARREASKGYVTTDAESP